jgi:hypothetical protein
MIWKEHFIFLSWEAKDNVGETQMHFFTTKGGNWEWCSCAQVIVTCADMKNGLQDKDALSVFGRLRFFP